MRSLFCLLVMTGLVAGCGDSGLPAGGDACAGCDGGASTADGGNSADLALDGAAMDAPPSAPDLAVDQAAVPMDAARRDVGVVEAIGATCLINSDCLNPLVCVFGRCHEQCLETRDCAIGQRCIKSSGGGVCQKESERRCVASESCPLPLFCAADLQCRNACAGDIDCTRNQRCAGGACADIDEVTSEGRLVGAPIADAGAGPDALMLWGLSRGINRAYTVKAVSNVDDGCQLGVETLVNMTLPVSYDETTQTISIGSIMGSPPAPSLGSGRVSANVATLVRDNNVLAGNCSFHIRDVSKLQLFFHDQFTLDVTEDESFFSAGCTDVPAGGKCTSRWRWTMVLAK
jgi:hypothetical protein